MKRLALLVLLPGFAWAQGAEQRPMPRPAALVQEARDAKVPKLRPMPKPWVAVRAEAVSPWPRPQPRPLGLTLVSAPRAEPQPQTQPKPDLKGAVCGLASIKGRDLPPMRSTTKGCGIAEPVEVTSVAGIPLSPPVTVNCTEARAFDTFVDQVLQPAFSDQVKAIRIADSYSCRHRNNLARGPVSVHGKGEAIDMQAVVLTTGQTVEVSSRLDGRLQRARKAACGLFTVILGPGSDGYHENHLHFDVSDHGGGPYCR